MSRRSDWLLLDPDSTNRFANKPTAQPPVLDQIDAHGYFTLFTGLRDLFLRRVLPVVALAGFIVGLGFLVLLLTGHI